MAKASRDAGADPTARPGAHILQDRVAGLADCLLVNPPFNSSGWVKDESRSDARWEYGAPPAENANFAWLQYVASTVSPRGTAAVMMPCSAAWTRRRSEAEIRQGMIEADLIESVVTLPERPFGTTRIPAAIWVLSRNKARHGTRRSRDRRGETLFIDARSLGVMIDRTHWKLTDNGISRITDALRAWRGAPGAASYSDSPGFSSSVKTRLIAELGYDLSPGRYIGNGGNEWPDLRIARVAADLKAAGWQVGRLSDFIKHVDYLRSEKAPERPARIAELRDEERLVLPIEPHFDAAYGRVPEAVIPNRCLLVSLMQQVNGIFLAAWLNSADGRQARNAAMPGTGTSPRTVSKIDRSRFLNALVVPDPSPEIQAAIADTTVMLKKMQSRAGQLAAELWRTPAIAGQIRPTTRHWLDSEATSRKQ
jgi:hypothetical protein